MGEQGAFDRMLHKATILREWSAVFGDRANLLTEPERLGVAFAWELGILIELKRWFADELEAPKGLEHEWIRGAAVQVGYRVVREERRVQAKLASIGLPARGRTADAFVELAGEKWDGVDSKVYRRLHLAFRFHVLDNLYHWATQYQPRQLAEILRGVIAKERDRIDVERQEARS